MLYVIRDRKRENNEQEKMLRCYIVILLLRTIMCEITKDIDSVRQWRKRSKNKYHMYTSPNIQCDKIVTKHKTDDAKAIAIAEK